MSDSPVVLTVADGVGHIELNRPEASNAIDQPLADALVRCVREAATNEQVRVVLLTGRGARFCAGGDLAAMAAAQDRRAFLQRLADTLHDGVRAFHSLAKPVVAGVHGAAAGAGLSLALGADLVVAGRGCSFVSAYAGVGLTPDGGQSWLLPRVVGQQRALELTLTSRRLSAEEAQDWGIVTRVVDDADVLDEARVLAAQLARGPAPALGRARRLVRDGAESDDLSAHLDLEARSIATAAAHPDSERLIAGFLRR